MARLTETASCFPGKLVGNLVEAGMRFADPDKRVARDRPCSADNLPGLGTGRVLVGELDQGTTRVAAGQLRRVGPAEWTV